MNWKIFSNVQDAVECLFSKETERDMIAIALVGALINKGEIDGDNLAIIKCIAGNVEVLSL